jgi:hypothetical protein
MHVQPNDDIDPYTLYVTADVSSREHNCADSCGRLAGWYLHKHPEDIAAVRATYDGRDSWCSGEPEPARIIFTLKTGREVSIGSANPHLSRLWALPALQAVGIDIMQLVFRPIGVDHEAPHHVKAACKTCTPGPDAASDAVLVAMLDYKTPVRDYVRPGAATTVCSELEQLLEFAGVDVPQIEDVA